MNKEELIKTLPTFTYHPNVYENTIVKFTDGVCDCCKRNVKAYVSLMYTFAKVNCICMQCIASGEAAKKFDGEFVDGAEEISNAKKKDILFHRTPPYASWQGEYWLACCDDYCEFLKDAGTKELEELGICDELIKEYSDKFNENFDYIKGNLKAGGKVAGYLFKCKHCDRYHLYVDFMEED